VGPAPDRGVRRRHPDDGDAAPGGHSRQALAELGRGDAADDLAEPFTASVALAAGGADLVEAQILHGQQGAALGLGEVEDLGDRRAQVPVPGAGGQILGDHGDVGQAGDRVAGAVEHRRGQEAVVQVER
jgi:hypothetical protein